MGLQNGEFEKPRYVIFALQTGRKNIMPQDVSVFDACNLSNVKLYLNSFYPYDDLNLDFAKRDPSCLVCTRVFAYYGIDYFETLLAVHSFVEKGTFCGH